MALFIRYYNYHNYFPYNRFQLAILARTQGMAILARTQGMASLTAIGDQLNH